MTSIFLAERWSRVGDTVSALNCQFASLAAQNRQKKICCVVLKATEEEKKDAADCGVELILPCLSEDIKDAFGNDEPSFKWLLSPESYFLTLTTLQNVEYIIEHVKSSTSLLFASALRKFCFKDADIVLINHVIPSVDLRNIHLKFAEAAAAVFSVGPTVFEEYAKLYQMTKIQIKHELYLPRPEKAFFDLNVDQMSRTSDLKQILTLITEKKVESTRFKDLSAAVGQTADRFQFMCTKIPKWFVRAPSAVDLKSTKTYLTDNLNCTCIEPNTYPPYGSQEEIYNDLKESNVLVIPPDEPFRMEALWAIAAGLPVLIPRRTAMAEFLKKYFDERAEYFLYEPSVDDLSKQISKMLNNPKVTGEARYLKNVFQSHREINRSSEDFKGCFAEIPCHNTGTGSVAEVVSLQQSTDDGIGSIEDTFSQQSLSPKPVSPEAPCLSHEASAKPPQSVPVIPRKRPFMPTIQCEADLEILEKKMKMETAQMVDRERQQLELQRERDKQQLEFQKEKDHLQFKKENKEMLRAEIKKLYELQRKQIMARKSRNMVKELDEAYKMFKARLDAIADGSLLFMLSFLSEEDIDYFWFKYRAGEVDEVLTGILITPEMRLLAEKAECTARIRLKIDKKEYDLVKEILQESKDLPTSTKSMSLIPVYQKLQAMRPQTKTEKWSSETETLRTESKQTGPVYMFEGGPPASQYVYTYLPSKVGVPESQQPVTLKERTVMNILELEERSFYHTLTVQTAAQTIIKSFRGTVIRRHLTFPVEQTSSTLLEQDDDEERSFYRRHAVQTAARIFIEAFRGTVIRRHLTFPVEQTSLTLLEQDDDEG